MSETSQRILGRGAVSAALLLSALASCGCLAIAGATAGGAALGYVYYKGELSNIYTAGLEDGRSATRAALADLGMPILKEEITQGSEYFESRTNQGDRVRVYLSNQASKIPAEGPLTRVSIRVGIFGDQEVSERVLNQIGAHLIPVSAGVNPPVVPLAPPTGGFQPTAAIGPAAPQSPPPPLAK